MAINKLLFTGFFGKKNNTSEVKELNISGDCTITNYDPRTEDTPDAYVKARSYKNSVFIQEGAKSDKTANVADFSTKKANILEEISKLDATDGGLSKKDILKIDQYNKSDYIKKWGLKDLAVDHKNGVLTVKWGEKDILRIDFSSKTNSEAPQKGTEVQQKTADISKPEVKPEQSQKQEKPSKYIVKKGDTLYSIAKRFGLTVGALKEMNPGLTNTIEIGQEIKLAEEKKKNEVKQVQAQTSKQEIPKTYRVQRGDTLSQIAQKFGLSINSILKMNKDLEPNKIKIGQVLTLRLDKNIAVTPQNTSTKAKAPRVAVEKIISKFTGGRIDISKVKDLETVAKYTGISKDYIKDILVGLEGKNKWPLCEAEYDGVKDKKHPRGHLTIGFGHTSLAGDPTVTEGMKITEKQAYQILANDIVKANIIAKNKMKNQGLEFENIPKSIQSAIIDIVFNKGPSGINENLVANLKEGYYAAAARRTWYQTPNVGLQKRNMFRFIEAIDSLSFSHKRKAVQVFRKDHEKELKNVFKKDPAAKLAWNSMCNEIFYKEALF